jgi:hypothetical protein
MFEYVVGILLRGAAWSFLRVKSVREVSRGFWMLDS